MRNIYTLLACLCLFTSLTLAQNVGVSTSSPEAKLDVVSTNSGVLIPRIALDSTDDVTTVPSSTVSELIYNTATAGSGSKAVTPGFYYWNGSQWIRIKVGAEGEDHDWYESGASAPDDINDNIYTQGDVGIGTISPDQQLEVAQNVRISGDSIFGSTNVASQFNILSNGGVRINLDYNNDGSESFGIKNSVGTINFEVFEGGNVVGDGNATFAGDLTLSGNSRTISSGTALNIEGASGIDIMIDSDSTGTGSFFKIQSDGDNGTDVFRIAEDGDARIYGTATVDDLAGTGSRNVIVDPSGLLQEGSLVSDIGDITEVIAGDGLVGGGASGSVTVDVVAENGLTHFTDKIELGGTLTKSTTITQPGTNSMTFNLTGTGDFRVRENGNPAFFVKDNGGFVGIGTEAPTYELDVSGNIGLNRYLYHNGDDNTNLDFTPDRVRLNVGALEIFDAQTSENEIAFNDVSADNISVRIESDNDANLFITDPANDRVGISTATPDYKLDVAGTVGVNDYIYHNDDSDDDTWMYYTDNRWRLNVGGLDMIDAQSASNEIVINETGVNNLRFRVESDNEAYLINTDATNDRVGIGTSSPLGILHIDDDQPVFRVYDAGLSNGQLSSIRLGKADVANEALGIEHKQDATTSRTSFHYYGDNFADALVIEKGGNVGIDIEDPTANLDIDGTLRIRPGAAVDYVLTSDGIGNATWEDPNTIGIKDHDWFQTGGTNSPTSINDWIYTMGNIGINYGDDGGENPFAALHVQTNIYAGDANTGTFFNSNAILHLARNDNPHLLMEDISNNTGGFSLDGGGLNVVTENSDIDFRTGVTGNGDWSSTGTSRMFIESGGDVGIGNTNPDHKLHVTGNIRATTTIQADANNTWYLRGGDDHELRDINSANFMGLWGRQNADQGGLQLGSDNSYIYGDGGYIGVATTSPTSTLHVVGGGADGTPNVTGVQIKGDANASIELTGTATPFIDFQNDVSGTDYDVRIRLTGNDYLAIEGGYLGINTTAPAGRLEIENTSTEYLVYSTTGNLSVYDPESSSSEVRLGAAWDRPGVYSSGGLNLFTASGQNIILGNNNVEYARMESDGDVGIGTTAPNTKFHVNAASGDLMRVQDSGSTKFFIEDGGNVAVGAFFDPDDALDVSGTAHVSSYLKVGNPSAPTSINPAQDNLQLYTMNGNSLYNGFAAENVCGTSIWQGSNTGTGATDQGVMRWDNLGTRSLDRLYTPWIWIPSNVTDIVAEMTHYCTLEDSYDGVYFEYRTSGGSWTKLTSFAAGTQGYPDNADGSNTACSADNNQSCWNGNLNLTISATTRTVSNDWVQFRYVASEDESTGDGIYYVHGIGVYTNTYTGTFGGSFASGNIYSENNIYAGSNVLLGDLAEYFPVAGSSKPGDLIAMIEGGADKYMISQGRYDANVIGVYSSNPTLTLNSPKSGVPVGLQGRVPVNVTNSNGNIQKGNYLTASDIPGQAMKATKAGFVVGRALEDFNEKSGQIICLIQTGWFNPGNNSNQNSGSFTIPAGKEAITVFDESVGKDSKVFLTMLADPIHRYWISNKQDGSFVLSLNNKSEAELPFDYFIDNARVGSTKEEFNEPHEEQIFASTEKNALSATSNKKKEKRPGPDINPIKDWETFDLPQFVEGTPPEVPNKETGLYWWAPHTGLVECGSLPVDSSPEIENYQMKDEFYEKER